MTEDRRLRDKLAKLAAEETGAAERRLAGDDPVRAMLEEIDETILARRLAFRGTDGAMLSLEAANRRLLGLVEAPDDVSASEDRSSLFAPLPPDDDDALAMVAAALQRFAAGRGPLSVTAAPLGREVGAGTRGRSAAAVAEALGFALYDPPALPVTPDPALGFRAGLAQLALAVLELEDEQPGSATGPDEEAADRLARLDAATVSVLAAELGAGQNGEAGFLLLSGAEEALFVGRKTDGRTVAAVLPVHHADAAAALWRATGGA